LFVIGFDFIFVLQISLAHRVLGKDMEGLVEACKLATKYSTTLLDVDYKK